MNILINFLVGLIILVPIIITAISYMVYSNNKNKKKLLCLTLPNYILSVIVPAIITVFVGFGLNYEYAFGIFLNGLANYKIYSWSLLILTVGQIAVTCINGAYLGSEKMKLEKVQDKKKITLKLGKVEKIVLICVIVLFLTVLVTDICMLENEQEPIFCIKTGSYSDGGTKVYLGFGYKIIDYNVIDGYDGYKIGTWFMQYDNSL